MLKVIKSIDEILREISDETRNYADLFEILAPGQGSHKSKKTLLSPSISSNLAC